MRMPRRRLLTCCLLLSGAGLCLWLMLVVSGGGGGGSSSQNHAPPHTAPSELHGVRHPPSTSARLPPSTANSVAEIGHSPAVYGAYTGPLSFVDDPFADRMHVVDGLGEGGVAATVEPRDQAEGINFCEILDIFP